MSDRVDIFLDMSGLEDFLSMFAGPQGKPSPSAQSCASLQHDTVSIINALKLWVRDGRVNLRAETKFFRWDGLPDLRQGTATPGDPAQRNRPVPAAADDAAADDGPKARAAAAALALGVLVCDLDEPGRWNPQRTTLSRRFDETSRRRGSSMRAVLAQAGLTPWGSDAGFTLDRIKAMVAAVWSGTTVMDGNTACAFELLMFCRGLARLTMRNPAKVRGWTEQARADVRMMMDALKDLQLRTYSDGTFQDLFQKAAAALVPPTSPARPALEG
ncbi:unnamed protein product [Pedinophyceae sp. YPF-701]|nr:unnamed protein product [Pedinophyceae sp. YPF-701]